MDLYFAGTGMSSRRVMRDFHPDRDLLLARAIDQDSNSSGMNTDVPIRDFVIPRDSAGDIANILDRNLNFAYCLAYNLDLTKDRAFALHLAMNNDIYNKSIDMVIDLALHCIPFHDLAIQLSERLNLTEFRVELERISLPKNNCGAKEAYSFLKELLELSEKYADNWNPFRQITISDEVIDLLPKELEIFTPYLTANKLLVQCLQIATVPDRKAIEDKILMPIEQ